MKDIVIIENNENDERLAHIERLFCDWLKHQTHLPKNYDVNMLRNWIRGTKYNFEKTKKKFENYFMAKLNHPEFYKNRSPRDQQTEDIQKIVTMFAIERQPGTAERLWIFGLAALGPNTADFCMVDVLRLLFISMDFVYSRADAQVNDVAIFDAKHLNSAHLAKFVSVHFKHALKIVQDAYAVRLARIHIINAPTFVDSLVNLIRPFVHEKIRNRYMVHKATEGLGDYVDLSLLPVDLGGKEATSSREMSQKWFSMLDSNCKFFLGQEEVNAIASARKTEFNGLEGSFRKLNID